MSAKSFQAIFQSLKGGNIAPIYVLHGEELFFIEKISDYIAENVLQPSEKAFNQVIWYGKDVNAKAIADEARQYPMMSQKRVVIIKEAQAMRDLKDLEHYAMQPSPTTVLVICHPFKKVDGRTRFIKEANKNGVVFESRKLGDRDLGNWIQGYVADHKSSIKPDAVDTLIAFVGNDLSRLGHALDNLTVKQGSGQAISRGDVLDSISISREYNIFELQKALGKKDAASVELIVQYFTSNIKAHPMPMVIGTLYSFFSRLLIVRSLNSSNPKAVAQAIGLGSEYFAREYIAAARNYSLAQVTAVIGILNSYDGYSKGISNRSRDGSALLRQMVQEILYVHQTTSS